MAKKKGVPTPNHWPLVIVVWKDHTSRDSWDEPGQTLENLKSPDVFSIGWLMHEDGESYSITSCAAPNDGSVSCSQRILKGTVVEFKILTKVKAKKEKASA